MKLFIAKSDDLYQKASEIELCLYPTMCLLLRNNISRKKLIEEARRIEQAARDICKQCHKIAGSGFLLPESSLLRKAVVIEFFT